mmetsp:Transcript_1884/g.4198  ORF Transcript_1884/g.4198 Transcript_1884/m.4198 type:complete len:256 (-) Transcript_1884:1107-1874(-)
MQPSCVHHSAPARGEESGSLPHPRRLGTHLMMSSTRRIISDASVAELSTWFLTLNASKMPRSAMSPASPRTTSTPMRVLESAPWDARRLATISALSRPALSQMVAGRARNARANASIASDFLPGVFAASSSTALAIFISGQPPPYTTRESRMVAWSTHSASCRERSASSRMCVLAPRRTIVQASPIATPEKWMSLSSPIMISSISLQLPSLISSGRSNVDTISPPSTRARFSMPSKSACSMAMTPASANISSGKL